MAPGLLSFALGIQYPHMTPSTWEPCLPFFTHFAPAKVSSPSCLFLAHSFVRCPDPLPAPTVPMGMLATCRIPAHCSSRPALLQMWVLTVCLLTYWVQWTLRRGQATMHTLDALD